jgi:hypothetical protein
MANTFGSVRCGLAFGRLARFVLPIFLLFALPAFLFLALFAPRIAARPWPPGAAPAAAAPQASDRFDRLVRSDMFAGMAGDPEALARAMKQCEEALAGDPKKPEALVWHGSGLVFQAGQMFRGGDYQNGKAAIIRGFREMDDAAALAPGDIRVLIPRGASLLGYAAHATDPARARPQLEKGLADYEKVLAIQKPVWDTLPVHSRGELLSGLVEGWLRAGEAAKARDYARRIVSDLPASRYATRAKAFLAEANPPAQLHWECMGCHVAAGHS